MAVRGCEQCSRELSRRYRGHPNRPPREGQAGSGNRPHTGVVAATRQLVVNRLIRALETVLEGDLRHPFDFRCEARVVAVAAADALRSCQIVSAPRFDTHDSLDDVYKLIDGDKPVTSRFSARRAARHDPKVLDAVIDVHETSGLVPSPKISISLGSERP